MVLVPANLPTIFGGVHVGTWFLLDKKRRPKSHFSLWFRSPMDYFGLLVGAEGETRTPMKEPSLDPEPSVSTNSTTSAWKGGIPKTFRAGKRKNALSEKISAKTTLPSVFPPDFGSAPPRNWRRHPLSHGEDAGRADCPPQE